MNMRTFPIALLLGLGLTAACRSRDANASSPSTVSAPASPGVVDSAIAPEKALRRFRVGLDSVDRLDSSSAQTRDMLVSRFVHAVARRDTIALRRMSLSKPEFAYLYYPSTQYVRPPYETAPDVLWQLMSARSGSGLRRLVARVGGAPIHLVSYECEAKPTIQQDNQFFERCLLRYRRAQVDSVEQRRLFGSIIRRGGRYKFVSYANDF